MKKVKYKKIRGQNRRLRAIEQWVKNNQNLDLDYLTEYHRDYVKFWVHPWSDLTVTNSQYPHPTGIYFEKMVVGLMEIYQSWKITLDALDEPYYLKIWLFQNEPARSQVVCAIRDSLHFYDNTFEIAENQQAIFDNFELTPPLIEQLEAFNWLKTIENDYIFEDYLAPIDTYETLEDYEADKKWFEHIKLTAKQEKLSKELNLGYEFCYVVPKGIVWVGELK